MTKKTAAWLFRGAAIYGVLILLPLYFLESRAAAPAALLPAPEYYYGFLGSALAFQWLYWKIGGDPLRHREWMPIAVAAKLGFWIPVAILWATGRTATNTFAIASVDLLLAIGFFMAWRSLSTGD